MTNENLLQAMGRIDPKLIADAAPDADQKKGTDKTWTKWASIAACFVLILSAVIVVPMLREDEPTSQLPIDINNIIWDTDIGDSPAISIEIPLWEGWRVDSYSLYQELEKADPNQYFALHISKTFWDDFVYNGKTVAQIRQEKEDKYNLFEKLAQLLKDGDVLKYGELVYTVGTPDGEKWAKELYDERIEYYGEELLSKYIVDGEFYKAQVEEDSSNAIAEAEQLEIMDDDAYKAYHSNYLDDTEKIFSEMGFYTVVKNKKLFVFIQKEKLAKLDLADKGSYKLRLAKRRNYEHEEGDIPTYEDNVTGFALEKIECETFDHSSRFAKTDAELIDKINALIEAGQFDTDRIRISITSSAALSEDVFKDMNYETINVTRKYQTSAFAWLSVKYENINLEALKEISNMNTIKSISIYLENEVPELAG
ncbi:MAG: hypothetical protein IJB43_05670 [Clostridia bacterium]|nr:hypothetical protein [Clostridia bacterium]